MTLKQRKHMAKTDCAFLLLLVVCGVILVIDGKVALGVTVAAIFSLLLAMKVYQLRKLNQRSAPIAKFDNKNQSL